MSEQVGDPEDLPTPLPTNAEDAKTLKALSNLDAHADDEVSSQSANNTNAEALGKATAGLGSLSASTPAPAKKAVVKVSQDDVQLIVNEMEVSKAKATELLKENGADVVKTLKAMIAPPA